MIRVAVVEDQDDIREGLLRLIGTAEGFESVAGFSNAEDALADLPAHCPDVVLMDVQLPGMDGIECVRRLKVACPDVQFMMLTVYEDDEHIYQALVAGASGYVLKKTAPARLLEAIADLHAGGSPMSSQIARKVVQAFASRPPSEEQAVPETSPEAEQLTRREMEVLSYMARGYRYREVADALFVSVETVRTHLRHVYEKLHVRSRTEAVNKVYGR